MSGVFTNSVFVEPYTVLGKKLRPFSAYHAITLIKFESPYADNGFVKPTLEDLVTAVLICCDGWGEGMPTFMRFTKSFFCKLAWGFKLMFLNLDKEHARFKNYIDEFTQTPDYWAGAEEETKMRVSGVVWPFHLASSLLVRARGFTEKEVWDMPLTRAVCYKACIEENDGASIADEDIEQAKRMLAEAEEKFSELEKKNASN